MSLGQVRLRPKANKAISEKNPHFGRPQFGGDQFGGDLDFLERLEKAEESDRFRQNQQKGHRAFQKRAADGSICSDQGISFGDDSSPQQHRTRNIYQTSNNATNEAMQQVHEAAKQRAHEATIRELLLQHGMSEQQIQHEIALWRREQAAGTAPPIPDSLEEASGEVHAPRTLQKRGENGQFLGQASEDPFKVRAARTGTPQKSKPWDIDGGFQDRNGLAAKVGKKSNAWDIDDTFKQRGSGPALGHNNRHADVEDPFKVRESPTQASSYQAASNSFHAQGVAAGGAARSITFNDAQRPGFMRDANQSSISGGIFG